MSVQKYYDSSVDKLPLWGEFQELIRYRYLIWQLIRRDILTRYKRSILGIAWTMLNPLGTMLVLSIVFSQAFGVGRNFAVYILSGLIAWLFFSQSTSSAITHLIWGEGLLKRIYLPRTAFTVSSIGVGLVNLTLSIVPLLFVMIITRVPIRWTVLLLPLPMIFLALFALGLALILSSVAVYFSDIAEMYQVILLAWMYLCPILYPEEYINKFPNFVLWIFRINPMYYLINLFRMPVYQGVIPDISQIILAGGIALGTAIVGWVFFTSRSDKLAYRL